MPPKKKKKKTAKQTKARATRSLIVDFVGEKIAYARVMLGRTQSDVAVRLGIKSSVVSHSEIGFSPPSIEKLCLLAVALGVDPGSLLPDVEQVREMLKSSGRSSRGLAKARPAPAPRKPTNVCAADIGRRIESRRVEAGLTQQQVASRISDAGSRGITRSAIGQWETGLAMPRIDRLCEVAAALGCDPGELLTG